MLEACVVLFISLAILAIIRQYEISWEEESQRLKDWRNFISRNPGMMIPGRRGITLPSPEDRRK